MKLRHFTAEEFACKCGCGLGLKDMDENLLLMLDEIRQELGRPVRINSAVRCQKHNAAVGGSAKSEHVPQNTHSGTCTGVDIHLPDSAFAFSLIKALNARHVPRLGLNQKKNFLHVGLSQKHAQHVFFSY